MKIARHKVAKPKWIRKRIEHYKNLIQLSIDNVAVRPDNLHSLISEGVHLADFQAAIRNERPGIRDALHVTCQATAAVFRNLTNPGVPFTIAGRNRLVCPHPPDPQSLVSGVWLFGFYAALICRDEELLQEIASHSLSDFEKSTTITGLEYEDAYAEGLRACFLGKRNGRKLIEKAIAASRKESASRLADSFLVPPLHLAESIYFCPDEFNDRLADAVQLHNEYYERELRRGNIAGYLAFRPLGLAALAVRRGIEIEVESDYLPAELLFPPQTGNDHQPKSVKQTARKKKAKATKKGGAQRESG